MEEDKEKKSVEYFDKTVTGSKLVAFGNFMVVICKLTEPRFIDLESKMGINRQLFQGKSILTLEQTEKNIELIEREPGLTILKKDLKNAPSREELFAMKEKHLAKKPKQEKKTVIEKVKEKVTGKKTTGRGRGRSKKK